MNAEEPNPEPTMSPKAKLGLFVAAAFGLGAGAGAFPERRGSRSEPCAKCGQLIRDTKVSAHYGRQGYYHAVCPKKETPKVPKAASALPD